MKPLRSSRSDTCQRPAAETAPNDPPPQQEPTHDVPVYPEHDPPPGSESSKTDAPRPDKEKRVIYEESTIS